MAAYAERVADTLRLRAFVARPDGSALRATERSVGWPSSEEEASRLGHTVGLELGRPEPAA
jgi:hypothetical protein